MKKEIIYLAMVFSIASCKKTDLTDQPEPGPTAEPVAKKGRIGSAENFR